MFGNQDGFPFVVTARKESVTADHPPTIHIFRLWQIYIDNINPLLKITHAPTVQGKIVEATSQLDRAPKNIEALMFAIYLMAVTSLEDFDVQRRFGEPKQELLGRYFSALQQALLNAGFMRNHDFYSLQAYVLYLVGSDHQQMPRSGSADLELACRPMVRGSAADVLPDRHRRPYRTTNGPPPGPGWFWAPSL